MGSNKSKVAEPSSVSGTPISVGAGVSGPLPPLLQAPVPRPEYLNLKSQAKRKPGSDDNVMHDIYNEDLDHIDHNMSQRIPPVVKQDFNSKAYSEAGRPCYELEKTMARCMQDKMWTAWKCQKERDTYYKCLHLAEEDPAVFQKFRWKYNAGVYPGEVVARNTIMKGLWKEYFPDRDIPHLWVDEG
jgi:hypothetical protein